MPTRTSYAEVVSYSQAHLRLKNDRGRPFMYECSSCGKQAQEWAYMGGCPGEMIGLGKRYSTDQSRYTPMCVSCHRRHDRAIADGRSVDACPRGHEWNRENTGIRKRRTASTGLRFCRACHREDSRKWRERKAHGHT